MNIFKNTENNKRYYTFTYYLKEKFGSKVAKVALNADFTCPNRDGRRGTGGCTFCSSLGSGDYAGSASLSLKEQFDSVSKIMDHKWSGCKYIAYLQAYTNTYAPLSKLKEIYSQVLAFDNIVGISIATRADCISIETADYLKELSEKTFLIVELGLQSSFDETGKRINRCHTYKEFLHGYKLLQDRGINICVHIINGLPGESSEMMIETAKRVAVLRPHSVKIHLLHLIRGTKLALEYDKGDFQLMEKSDYVSVVCSQLEYFHEDTVIQRLTGDGKLDDLIGPMWSVKKLTVMNDIDKEFIARNSYQGINYNKI